MRYQIGQLNVHCTPPAEPMNDYAGVLDTSFDFPGRIQTVLFIQCGTVRASRHGGTDYVEVVGRLYESSNPQQTEEDHVGKLYVHIYGTRAAPRFETSVEQLDWHGDGSFDIISPEGTRVRGTPREAGRYARSLSLGGFSRLGTEHRDITRVTRAERSNP